MRLNARAPIHIHIAIVYSTFQHVRQCVSYIGGGLGTRKATLPPKLFPRLELPLTRSSISVTVDVRS